MRKLLPMVLAAALLTAVARSAPPLDARVVEQAIARSENSLVQLRLASSQGRTSVTTGVVVSQNGWIATADFALADPEAAILVVLADGRALPAERVAVDEVRQIALLKADLSAANVRPPAAASQAPRVGQWALALGRTYSAQTPNVAVGVVSALSRLGGVALQTDAKTSPANYGGLLVDLDGRAVGLIVALPPVGEGRAAAAEYYDSGVGFAIPWHDVQAACAALESGADQKRGRLGLSLRPAAAPDEPARVAALRTGSPAAAAGLRVGDAIVALDGVEVPRGREMASRLQRLYAARPVELGVTRDGERLELSVTPVEKLPPPQLAYLGILPGDETDRGTTVRFVMPGGPAERAGIASGEVLEHADGQPLTRTPSDASRAQGQALALKVLEKHPGEPLLLQVRRGDESHEVTIALGAWDAALIPSELPPRAAAPQAKVAPQAPEAAAPAELPATGRLELPVAGRERPCLGYVPTTDMPSRGWGLVVWLHGPEGLDEQAALDAWRAGCEKHGLALVAPAADDPRRWTSGDVETIREAVAELARRTKIDPARTAVVGFQTGGAQALRVALAERGRFRGVAAIDAALAVEPPEFDPARPLLIYLATSSGSRFARRTADDVRRLREQGYSIAQRDLGPEPRTPNAEELAELARWVDSLDRL